MSTATQTFQESVQALQAWLDYLDAEDAKLQGQLARIQGSTLPDIEADIPSAGDTPVDAAPDIASAPDETEEDKWL